MEIDVPPLPRLVSGTGGKQKSPLRSPRFCAHRIPFAMRLADDSLGKVLSDNPRLLIFRPCDREKMANSLLLADLERALQLLEQVDERLLDFPPDPNVSPDVRELTGLQEYPVQSHRGNLQARIAAVIKAGDRLQPRNPSTYVSKLIVACARLAPPSDDSAYGHGVAPG